ARGRSGREYPEFSSSPLSAVPALVARRSRSARQCTFAAPRHAKIPAASTFGAWSAKCSGAESAGSERGRDRRRGWSHGEEWIIVEICTSLPDCARFRFRRGTAGIALALLVGCSAESQDPTTATAPAESRPAIAYEGLVTAERLRNADEDPGNWLMDGRTYS